MKMRTNSLAVILIALLLPASGAGSFEIVKSGTISGRVTESATGQPLLGASVLISGTTMGTTTDADGAFTLSGVPVGTHQLHASFVGYQSSISKKVEVCDGCTVCVDFQLEAGVDLDEMILENERPLVGQDAVRGKAAMEMYAPGLPASEYARVDHLRQAPFNTEEYAYIEEAGFLNPRISPLSTFSIDVDAASYSNMRRFLNSGSLPPMDAIRTEEFVNYFDYAYPHPRGDHPVEIYTELGAAPWNQDNLLLHVGLQAEELSREDLRPSNLVFLLDVSGSMNSEDKLGLLKKSFSLLVDELTENDRVAIVVYAGAAGLVLPPTPGSEKRTILDAIDRLEAGGSTAGGAGIQLAYSVASKHLIPRGNNRVILATDGDFNVGVSATGDLVRMITDRKKDGIGLTVLGFGTGNLKDSRMESIADKGDGNYYYIDSILEGKKIFVDELRATLYTVAKDVKIQVEFNPAIVGAYRLIGYENRALNAEDFEDDEKDAGEMGSGHTVTALYEIILTDRPSATSGGDLRYQSRSLDERLADELGLVKVRYKRPHGDRSIELDHIVDASLPDETSDDFQFAASVAMFSMLLRDSEYIGDTTADDIFELAGASIGPDDYGYRAEFLRLVDMYDRLEVADARVTGR